jgi:peptide chain release factor 1
MKWFKTAILLFLSHRITAFVVVPGTPSRRACLPLQMAVDEAMQDRLNNIKRSYQALTERLGDPDVINDSNLLRKVMSDRSSIEETVMTYDEWLQLKEEMEGAKELFQADDPELKEMAREEIKEIEPKMEELEDKIKILLLPKDPNDDRNIMLEIRAGTGGSEASIFAGKSSRAIGLTFSLLST